MRQVSFVSTAACLKSFILPCQEAGGLLTREREKLRRNLAVAPLGSLAPEIIFTTNDIPSIQTAEYVAARIDLAGPVIITPLLEENPHPLYFNRLLFLHARLQSLVFVLPQVGIHQLATGLFGLKEIPEIDPGEIMAFELSGRRREAPARLLWRTRDGEFLGRQTPIRPLERVQQVATPAV